MPTFAAFRADIPCAAASDGVAGGADDESGPGAPLAHATGTGYSDGDASGGAERRAPPELDAIDRRIVLELQEDGRITNVELARRAGISAPPCLRRVRRLEENGVLRGYHADVDPTRLGWSLTMFALIGLDSQKGSVLEAFERQVAEWPEIRECHMIRGGGDFLVRLVARDAEHQNQLTRRLTDCAHVARVQTLQTIRTSRDLAGVPI